MTPFPLIGDGWRINGEDLATLPVTDLPSALTEIRKWRRAIECIEITRRRECEKNQRNYWKKKHEEQEQQRRAMLRSVRMV